MKARSPQSAAARKPSADKHAADEGRKDSQVQGEGNHEAARRFNEAEQKYVKTADVDKAARAAQPSDPEEARELDRAERETREHAKDEDPQLRHPKARDARDRDTDPSPARDRQDDRAAPASPDGEESERYAG